MTLGDIKSLIVGAAVIVCGTIVPFGIGGSSVGVAGAAPSALVSLTPARLLDTRPGAPTVDGSASGTGRVSSSPDLELQVAGRGGVPSDASAAFLNLTAILPSTGTVLTVYPCDVVPVDKSNLNLPVGDIRANAVFAKLSPRGTVCIHTDFETDIAVDVNGYAPAEPSVQSLSPARLLDTRPGMPTVDGSGSGGGRVSWATDLLVQVAGRGGVPSDASAAFLNLTAILPSAGTVLTVYPCDVVPKDKSNLNLPVGDIRANAVFAKLSPQGTVCIHTDFETDIAVDVNGYVPAGASVQSLSPARLLDTRPGMPTVDGSASGGGRVQSSPDLVLQVTGRGGVPAGATAAFLNLTAISPSKGTVLTVYPCDVVPNDRSNLNLPASDIRANAVFAKLSPQGTVCIHTAYATHVAVDVNGYVPGEVVIIPPAAGNVTLVSCNAVTEQVVLKNTGGTTVALAGYELFDAGKKHTSNWGKIGVSELSPGQTMTLVSGPVSNPPVALPPGTYRWYDANIWNNAGDTAYLMSPTGEVTSVPCATKP